MKVYLMSARKNWHHFIPEGWNEIAFERFDYVECGIFEKNKESLTHTDELFMSAHLERPDGWIEPQEQARKALEGEG